MGTAARLRVCARTIHVFWSPLGTGSRLKTDPVRKSTLEIGREPVAPPAKPITGTDQLPRFSSQLALSAHVAVRQSAAEAVRRVLQIGHVRRKLKEADCGY